MPWCSRVPSLSNLADLLSRGADHFLLPSNLQSSHQERERHSGGMPPVSRESPGATFEMGGGRGRKAGGMILPPIK